MISTLTNFTLNELQQFVKMCTDSYVKTNPFLILKIETPEEFQAETRTMITKFVQAADTVNNKFKTDVMFNTFYRIEGIMVRAGFSCELYHYMNVVCKDFKDDFFVELSKMDLSDVPEGTAVTSIREVTHKDFYKRGLMKYSLIQKSKHLVSKGYIYDFIWTSNPVAYKVNTQLGGVTLKQFDTKIKDVQLKIYLIRRDMRIAASMQSGKL